MSRGQAQALRAMFAEFRPALLDQPLADFSGLRFGAAGVCEVAPRDAGTAARIVRAAHAQGIPLRTRAQGHSLNGSTFPQAAELLFATRNLRRVRFEEPGTVTVGCGVVLWILQVFLRRRGFDLPVLNDGYAGPSVGGYLAAGGFGPRSALHGGFWDNVLQVRLLDGRGETLLVTTGDERFPWLFGSMGQLGIFVEAKLAIVPLETSDPPPAYPMGASLVAPQLAQAKLPPEFTAGEDERLFWFTVFVPDEYLEEAHAELSELEHRHRQALRFQQRYRYPIRHRGRMPPLIYPEARPLTATGAWGWLRGKSAVETQKLFEFEREFMALAQGRPYYRRYVQSELPSGPEVYERCFGAETYAGFRRLKSELDPQELLNRGTVFPAPAIVTAARPAPRH